MASLQSLPNELLDNILSNLDFRDAINVSKTCRSLHSGALPTAYHSILLEWTNETKPDGSLPQPPQTKSLLRMLLDKPEYSKLVKSLEFRATMCLFYEDEGSPRVSIPSEAIETKDIDTVLAEDMVKRFQSPNQQQWGLPERDWSLFQAFVVGLCTRVESLSISVDFLLHSDWLLVLIDQGLAVIESAQGDPWFDNLKSMRITSDNDGYIWGVLFTLLRPTFLRLFYLKNVEKLELAGFVDPELPPGVSPPCIWSHNQAPDASKLTTLRLERCSITPNTLDFILQQTPNLETFEYFFVMHPSFEPMQLTKLGNALCQVRSTLKDLVLRYDIYTDEYMDVDVSDLPWTCAEGNVASLRDFPALVTLTISLPILFGLQELDQDYSHRLGDLLPPNLKVFTLTDDPWMGDEEPSYFDDGLVMKLFAGYFMGAEIYGMGSILPTSGITYGTVHWEQVDEEPPWKLATPQLKEVIYESEAVGIGWESWDYRAVWDEFKTRCKAQGIKLTVSYLPHEPLD